MKTPLSRISNGTVNHCCKQGPVKYKTDLPPPKKKKKGGGGTAGITSKHEQDNESWTYVDFWSPEGGVRLECFSSFLQIRCKKSIVVKRQSKSAILSLHSNKCQNCLLFGTKRPSTYASRLSGFTDRYDSPSGVRLALLLETVGALNFCWRCGSRFRPFRGSGGGGCLLYTSPSPRDMTISRMPSSA